MIQAPHRHECECGWRGRAMTPNGELARRLVEAARKKGILGRDGIQAEIARMSGVSRARVWQIVHQVGDGVYDGTVQADAG